MLLVADFLRKLFFEHYLKQKKATHKVFTETFSNTLCVAILLFYLIPKKKNLLRLIEVKT